MLKTPIAMLALQGIKPDNLRAPLAVSSGCTVTCARASTWLPQRLNKLRFLNEHEHARDVIRQVH